MKFAAAWEDAPGPADDGAAAVADAVLDAASNSALVPILVASVAAGLLTCLVLWARSKKAAMEKAANTAPFDGIPLAPDGHWFMGHMRGGDFRRRQFENMVRPASSPTDGSGGGFGSSGGLSSFWFFGTPAVSVLLGSDVRTVLNASSSRKGIPFLKKHNDRFLGPRALTAVNGRDWRRYRNAVHRSFTPAVLAESQEAINGVGNNLAASLRAAASATANASKDPHPKGSGRYVAEILPLMKMATIDVFGRSALGVDLGCCTALAPSPLAEAFDFLAAEYSRRIRRPFDPSSTWYWIPTAANRRHKSERRLIRNFIDELIEKGRRDAAEGREGGRTEFLTRLLKANDDEKATGKEGGDGDGDGMSDGIVADTLMVLLFGGYDTTSITLTYALYALATHPIIEAKVLAEIHAVVGPPQSGQSGEPPAVLEDHARLPLTRAVVLETLRLYPPPPITTRNLERPLELSSTGETVPPLPAGTMMHLPIWSIQRDERNYPRPEEFRPDRWVKRRGERGADKDGDEGGEEEAWVERTERDDDDKDGADNGTVGCEFGADAVPPANRDAFCAFSGGARNCVGRALAMQEAVTILACLLRDLRFETASSDYELRPQLSSFVQHPHDGLPMIITPREP